MGGVRGIVEERRAEQTTRRRRFHPRVLQEGLRWAARNEARSAHQALRVRPSLSTPSGNMLSRVLSKSTTLRSTPALSRTLSKLGLGLGLGLGLAQNLTLTLTLALALTLALTLALALTLTRALTLA